MENVKIRNITPEDGPAIEAILKNTPEFNQAEVKVAVQILDLHLEDPIDSGYHVLVAELSKRIVGYICFGATPLTEGTWDIYWIAASPDMKNRGIGKSLLAAAEEQIQSHGGKQILIATSGRPDYASTRQFYLRRGYDIISRIPDYYADGDDQLTFRKRALP